MTAPDELIGRDREWRALVEFVESGQRVGIVYGPRHAGTSYLLDHLCHMLGGRVHRCAPGTRHVQLRAMADFLGVDTGPDNPVTNWMNALERVRRLNVPLVVLDDVPALLANSPDLAEALARYDDIKHGPVLVLSGTSQPAMLSLLAHGSPLFGKVSMALTPSPLSAHDLARLWRVERPTSALWVDAVVGGLPGYRRLLPAPGEKVSSWMRSDVLAPQSPLLDLAESTVAEMSIGLDSGLARSVLESVAVGYSTADAVALEVGVALAESTSALHTLERNGALVRVRDPLRERRDCYDIADPHLRFWLAVVAPNRAALAAGRAAEVWGYVRDSVWRTRVLATRWDSVVRRHVEKLGFGRPDEPPIAYVGVSAGLDLVAVDVERRVVALGRTSLDALGVDDLRALEARRDQLGLADVDLILSSTVRVDAAAVRAGAVPVTPADVYGSLKATSGAVDPSGPWWRPTP